MSCALGKNNGIIVETAYDWFRDLLINGSKVILHSRLLVEFTIT